MYMTLRVAWISDDALVNIRTALNVKFGMGPVFNVGERVQGYTSPLWFWTQYFVGRIIGNFIISSILVSSLLASTSFLLICLLSRDFARKLLVLLLVFLSSSLIDYSTSGLENALAMLLVVLFLIFSDFFLLSGNSKWAILLSLTSAFCFLTRFDYIILLTPLLIYISLKVRKLKLLGLMTAVFAFPVTVWLVFSLNYYGSIFPNTYYAKLNVDIPRRELLITGLRYFWVSVEGDPALIASLTLAIYFVLRSSDRFKQIAFVSSFTYVGYVIWIGGDFMAGRFFTSAMLIWIWIVGSSHVDRHQESALKSSGHQEMAANLVFSLLVLLTGFNSMIANRPNFHSDERWNLESGGVADEGAFYRSRGLSLVDAILEEPRVVDSLPLRDEDLVSLRTLLRIEQLWSKQIVREPGISRSVAVTCGFLGNIGLKTGPSVFVIDKCGLTDPFLARIAFQGRNMDWRIGHFERQLPDGYLNAVKFDDATYVSDPVMRSLLYSVWARTRD
jgi:arabinofuranosyltransferase